MIASGVGNLDFLTRHHGVKIVFNSSIEECRLAVGEVVGFENVLSASRMNNAIVVFLKTIDLANTLVESGVVIDGFHFSTSPFYTVQKSHPV